MTSKDAIYLDNAATTRVAPEVCDTVLACMDEDFGNPSSAHFYGVNAEKRVSAAGSALMRAVGDDDGLGSIVWTSGGTESDGLAILGAARARAGRGKKLVHAATEHPAVRESAALLRNDGWDVVEVPVTDAGVVRPDQFASACEGAQVAALMLVNNEVGTVQPVAEVARAVRAVSPDIHFHSDAVQALGKISIDIHELGVDSLAFAAHKIHGPKGVGALWLRGSRRIDPLWAGGGQQRGIRAGTHNVPGIAGMGRAVELAVADLDERARQFEDYGARLVAAARKTGVEVHVNGQGARRAPHVLSLAFADVPSEPLLHVLESRGILVSAGSACSERNRKASPVLAAMRVPKNYGTVRLSFGRDTSSEDIETACSVLIDAVQSFR